MQKLEIGLTVKRDKIWENADRKANVENETAAILLLNSPFFLL